MVHTLLVLALIVLVVWFFGGFILHAAGGFIHLLLIAAIVLAVLWLLGFMRRGRSTTY